MVSRNGCSVGGTPVFKAFPSSRLIRARQRPGVGSNGSIRYPSYSVMGIRSRRELEPDWASCHCTMRIVSRTRKLSKGRSRAAVQKDIRAVTRGK